MPEPRKDWLDVQERLLRGDREACFELSRLITGMLVRLRAYDFRDEWDDLRQEVLLSIVQNARRGRLRDPQAFVGYVRIITRNKFVDRLKRSLRHAEKATLPWDEATAWSVSQSHDDGDAAEVWAAVRGLPEEQRRMVEGVYREGKTYQEVADETGVPLGTTKRRLRQALEALRARLVAGEDPG
jgi:RNA polymerase sigma-70 factor (ECF subfamily)